MIADAARKVIEPFAVAMRKLAAAAMPKPKHEQIRAALASPLLGLGGKLPRTLFPSTLVPGLGPEWWQERERRRKQAEDAADRRMGKAEKDAAEQATDALYGWPPLDMVMLGMGEDGHVASLFPGSPALAHGLDRTAPACIAVPQGRDRPPPQPRLSLTIRPLTQAAQVLILTSGAAKRAVLDQALAGGDPLQFPVRAVLQSARSVRILWTEHSS